MLYSDSNRLHTMKRISSAVSQTAEWTCAARAFSYCEPDPLFHSEDRIAPLLLPGFVKALPSIAFVRALYRRLAPKGLYPYVIARTKYIDAVFQRALRENFEQILILGAGFDTRGLRFALNGTKVFELDAPVTQKAKRAQLVKRDVEIPPNLRFVSIDFDTENLADRLLSAGLPVGSRTLFVLEGLLMYLEPASVECMLRTVQEFAGPRNWIVFDYVYASVLRHERLYYGEAEALASVTKAGEQWRFGIERGKVDDFLAGYGFRLTDESDASALEKAYFTDARGEAVARLNGAHSLVTAEKS